MIKEAIIKIVNKEDLSYEEARETMLEIMRGETSATQNAAFLAALSTKSAKAETIDEISGCATAMRSLATPVEHPGMEVLEIVGTGGDGAHSFNVSTTAAMVVAAGGVKVAKHGNRAASSLSGTADCLEALGVNIAQDPALCRKMLEEAGFCFMFAQKYHAAMKYVGPIRKELGFRACTHQSEDAVFSPQVRLESLFGSKQNAKMNELRVIKLLCQKEHRSFLFSPEFLKMLHDVAQEHDDKVEPLFELSNFANTSFFVILNQNNGLISLDAAIPVNFRTETAGGTFALPIDQPVISVQDDKE